jgi:hypothetical protein
MVQAACSPRIIFICPPSGKINGGIKYLFRMAEALQAQGQDAVVCEATQTRPAWFASTAPLVGLEALAPNPAQILVLPEDQPALLRTFATWPQRKIIYCQNHFYAAIGIDKSAGFAAFGVTDMLCSSATIVAYCRERHPQLTPHFIPCGVDPAHFAAKPKQSRIALVPRKRQIEALYLRDMFCHHYPAWRDIIWQELTDCSEASMATALGEAAVFLALSRLDGFGLTPIEAMAAGCVVAGFTGIGGRDYATAANGFWADEDDFPAALTALQQALTLWQTGGAPLAAYHAAAQATAAHYTPALFAAAIAKVWVALLQP